MGAASSSIFASAAAGYYYYHQGAASGSFCGSRKVCRLRQPSNSCPIRLILWRCSHLGDPLCAHRYDYEQREARRRPRPYRVRPRRGRRRRRRPRRLRLRASGRPARRHGRTPGPNVHEKVGSFGCMNADVCAWPVAHARRSPAGRGHQGGGRGRRRSAGTACSARLWFLICIILPSSRILDFDELPYMVTATHDVAQRPDEL